MSQPPSAPPPVDRAISHTANLTADHRQGREIACQVRDLLAPALAGEATDSPLIEVVDIGANPIDGDPPYRLALDVGLCRITGFEPQPDALSELLRRSGPYERYLPYAIGDGDSHTLNLCATSGFASLLEPDDRQLAYLTDFPQLAEIVGREPIATRRLDDVQEIHRIDLLKIDIQGGELPALRAGRRQLAGAVAVQTEVGFHRLYRKQPTFADVDLELRDQGFVPHQFVSTRTWPVAPVVWADPLHTAARQLVEADILYVRDPVRTENLSDDQLARMALICDVVYGSFGLALRCILELITRGLLDANAEHAYRSLAASRLPT